jgi:molybdenum cofactor cytidylyltransferase
MIAALVPAAGQSRRMGRPKPLLDIGGMPLVARVVSALRDGGADRVLVVAPPAERAESAAIVRQAQRQGADVLVLERQTPDMRATIEVGLDHLETLRASALLVAPADLPGMDARLVARVVEAGRTANAIARPRAGHRRGHPLYLPWEIARAIRSLPAGAGVNTLVDDPSQTIVEVEVANDQDLADLDTPEDYRRWS